MYFYNVIKIDLNAEISTKTRSIIKNKRDS